MWMATQAKRTGSPIGFDVPEGYALECLVLGEGEQRQVYIVTTDAPAEYACIHDRWPLLEEL